MSVGQSGDRPSVADARAGEVIGDRLEIRREIARGGASVVFEAQQRHLDRRVAVKLPLERDAPVGSTHLRLLQEARALEMCRGPCVVEVIDAGFHSGAPYLAMEMLDGRPLDGLLAARQRLPIATAAGVVAELCEALASVHAAQIVHRDVKPSNIFITRTRGGYERVKLLDFGVARIGGQRDQPKLTQAGERVGTLEYMAPEQLLGEEVDHRTDVFAAGTVFFECVAGEPPFPGGPRELLTTLLAGHPPPSLANLIPGAPPGLDALMKSLLARDPAKRPTSAGALAEQLRALVGESADVVRVLDVPVPARPNADTGRKLPRAPYVAPVRVIGADTSVHDGQTGDLSEGGAFVLLETPMYVGAEVVLRFGMPIAGRVISVRALVRWTRAARHRHAVGFEFIELAPDALADIRRFIELSVPATTGTS